MADRRSLRSAGAGMTALDRDIQWGCHQHLQRLQATAASTANPRRYPAMQGPAFDAFGDQRKSADRAAVAYLYAGKNHAVRANHDVLADKNRGNGGISQMLTHHRTGERISAEVIAGGENLGAVRDAGKVGDVDPTAAAEQAVQSNVDVAAKLQPARRGDDRRECVDPHMVADLDPLRPVDVGQLRHLHIFANSLEAEAPQLFGAVIARIERVYHGATIARAGLSASHDGGGGAACPASNW